MSEVQNINWFLDDVEVEDLQIDEYDITSTPNDFNVMTIYHFIESGSIKIPGFQRNYVWDIKKASKLIESLILGLPVPQLFIYEQGRNSFLVIDGQQRLMSIYYFIKGRFPKKEKRAELRDIFSSENGIPDNILLNDEYFQKFNLSLPTGLNGVKNKFHGKNIGTLDEFRTQFDLRPLRNIVIKQNSPDNDDSSMYEIFNRLNSGGANLKPQEIRASMYHSEFYTMLQRLNKDSLWRDILSLQEVDLNMKDIEILLRAFAMLIYFEKYGSSMSKFLNEFSKEMKGLSKEKIDYLERLFMSFLSSCDELPSKIFNTRGTTGRFSIALFECVFRTICKPVFDKGEYVTTKLDQSKINELKNNPDFVEASAEGTGKLSNINKRFEVAERILNN